MEIRTVGYEHPDAAKMIADVQQVYVERYGTMDETPVDPDDFAPPQGLFMIGYVDLTSLAKRGDEGWWPGEGLAACVCGGWRAHDGPQPEYRPGDAEMKRLYVPKRLRGNGFARRMLAEIEQTAREAGRRRMILETGTKQPEAIELYRSTGYEPIPKFGHYRCDPLSVCFAKAL